MKPKFKNSLAWQQAELLIQPCLIRLLDNIRKYLEASSWEGTYENVQTPVPGYLLCLKMGANQITFDLWELCYQICFINYKPTHADAETQEVEIDTSLIDETGDVDWHRLETKTQQLVQQIFANLPTD